MPGTQSINVEFSRNLSRNRSFPLLGYALAACLFLMGVGTGCTWFKDKPELSAEDNYLKGMAEYKDKDYKDAIPYFQKILENYPFSIHAIPAELRLRSAIIMTKSTWRPLSTFRDSKNFTPRTIKSPM